ncbi:UbiA domain-containing protein [Cephalotus follicularis]|uniref:UbiA domain-containing protein n=1 Tax=Cephalotus follicularis TaxID=3775 RepID=A0A1Q3BBP7_CEPFO|nr:UbiA domain-containing protein [Cephalotus follicularis]
MAAAFCNFNVGSSVKKLNEYFEEQSYVKRSYLGAASSKASNRLSLFGCNAKRFSRNTYSRQSEVKQQCRCEQVSPDSKAIYGYSGLEEGKEEDVAKATLIWRAIKLPIYSVALVPVTVGSAAAYLQTGMFSARRYFLLLASSFLIISWLNLSNDVYDFDTGADKNKKESVVNLTGSRTVTLIAAYSLLVLGFMGLTWASVETGNMCSILLLACAVLCGYIYQCPPFRFSYQGLGEPLCFAAFGPFATTAFYLLSGSTSEVSCLSLTSTILSASLLVGFTTSLILFCSHFHQVEGDKAVGKMSPLVRLGTRRGSEIVNVAVITLYSLLFAFGLSRSLPSTCIILCALTLPMGKLVVSYVEENHRDNAKIFMAKYYCVRLHALFGVALSAGLLAARMLSRRYVTMPSP